MQGRARQEGWAAKFSAGGVPDGTELEDLLPGLPQLVSPAASTVPLKEMRKVPGAAAGSIATADDR